MRRREAVAVLTGAKLWAGEPAAKPLAQYMDGASGAAVLVDIATRKVLAVHAPDVANRYLAPPGSTIKPFVLAALMTAGKLSAAESFPCPGGLRLAGRSFDCTHPVLNRPLTSDLALAYSCNCFVAHVAERFAAGELARALVDFGEVHPVSAPDAIRVQALGETAVRTTAMGLALAFARLARKAPPPVLTGLEEAVEFGTARGAQIPGPLVAGKTGSVHTAEGARIAWFGGFLPSRDPKVAVSVMVQGRSGGADAAPIAGRILRAYTEGRL